MTSRIIKFRAWDRKMKHFIYGTLDKWYFDVTHHPDGKIKGDESGIDLESTKDDRSNWMQYTGLKDKNGKEIYEGDVVKVYDFNRFPKHQDIDEDHDIEHCSECLLETYICTQKIEWKCGYFCDEEIGDYCPTLSEDFIYMEIIGNIYES